MGAFSLGRERGALLDAETVLLVRDDKPQPVVFNVLAYEGVGADGQSRLAGGQLGQGFAPGFGAH